MLEHSSTPNDVYVMLRSSLSDGICDLFLDLKSFGEVFHFMMNFLVSYDFDVVD